MSLLAKDTRDLVHLNFVGHSLFQLIKKVREYPGVPEQVPTWQEGYDGIEIGYEASWAGIFPPPVK